MKIEHNGSSVTVAYIAEYANKLTLHFSCKIDFLHFSCKIDSLFQTFLACVDYQKMDGPIEEHEEKKERCGCWVCQQVTQISIEFCLGAVTRLPVPLAAPPAEPKSFMVPVINYHEKFEPRVPGSDHGGLIRIAMAMSLRNVKEENPTNLKSLKRKRFIQ